MASDSTYVTCSICRSILGSRHRCRSCIVRGQYIVHHMSTVRRGHQTIPDYSDTWKTRRFRSVRSPSCKRLGSSRRRSSDVRKRMRRFRDRSVHDPSSLASIGTPAGLSFRNLLPASLLCRSTDRKCSFRDRNKTRLDIRLRKTSISHENPELKRQNTDLGRKTVPSIRARNDIRLQYIDRDSSKWAFRIQ